MTDHYFDPDPKAIERQQTLNTVLLDLPFTFTTASGMFSVKRIDRGTEVLITYADVDNDAQHILDLGCAYGAVGIALAKKYGVRATLVDVNPRAVKYAKKNAVANQVGDLCTFKVTDGFAKLAEQQFDIILFNPPQHAGKQVCMQLITESKEHLQKGGSLQVVARHNKGGASFEKHMIDHFGNMEILARKSGYRVYKSIKND